MNDDPNAFEPGTAGQIARLVAAMRQLRDEAGALAANGPAIASEIAVLRSELAAVRGGQERQTQMLAAVVAEQARQGVVLSQIGNALADIFYAVVAAPPEPAEAR